MFFWHYNNLFFRIIRYRNFLPLVSILIGGDYNFFGQQIENYLSTYDENTIIIFSCIFIINLYFFNNIFLFVYNYSLTLYTRNIQYRISTDLLSRRGEFKHNWDTFLLRNSIIFKLKFSIFYYFYNFIIFLMKNLPFQILKLIYKVR